MKKTILLIFVLCLCLPLLAKDRRHKLEIAYEGSDYGYREPHMEYPIHVTAKKKGVSVVYTQQSVLSKDLNDDDPSFASLELRFMNGKADYDGYWSDGMPFKNENERDWYMEAALKFGQKYQLANSLELRPYIGIGWRELRNGEDAVVDRGDGSSGLVYRRTSTYVYMPIGMHFNWDIGDFLTLSLNGEFDWLLHGNQNSHTGDMFTNADSISNKQDKGYGVRASVKAELDLGGIGVFAEPFWRYWKIQDSAKAWYDIVDANGNPTGYGGYMIEPFNITREYGMRVGITFW